MSRLINILIQRPRTSLVLFTLVMLAVGAGAVRLQVDFSPEQVYVGRDNAVEFCELHKQQFRFEDSVIFVALESTDHRSLLREDCLNWLVRLAERAEKMPGVQRVTSLVTLERPSVSFRRGGDVQWKPWLRKDLFADEEYVTGHVSRMPLLNDTLVSEDQQLLLTLIDLDPNDRTILKATQHVRAIEKLLKELPSPPGTQTFISGVPAIRVDVIDSIINDQLRMVPICSALFIFMSLVMFRSWRVTLLSLLSALSALILTLGLMGWAGLTFTVMSNMIPALLLIIAAANNVHIISRFQVAARRTPHPDIPHCVRLTMTEMSRTCFLTLATTAIGFGSLLLARAELLQSLAIQAVFGMACCYAGLMLVLPQALVLFGHEIIRDSRLKKFAVRTLRGNAHISMWRQLGQWICRNAVWLVIVHLLLAGGTLWMSRDIAINSYMFETYDGQHPTMQAIRKLDSRLSGLISLEVQLRAATRERLLDTDVAEAMARIRRRVPADERVTFYRDYIEFLAVFDHGKTVELTGPELQKSLRRVQFVLRQLNDQDAASAFLGSDETVARIMMRIRDVGSAGMQDLIARVERILKEELPEDIQFQVTGDAYLHAVCMDSFVRDLFYSLLAASGVILLLITLLFRSLRIGLISAVPNMFPLVMTLGYMHLRGYELTAGNVIVFAISLGIAVDDTIHFLARFRDEVTTEPVTEAVLATLHSSGRAIVLTSVLVVSGLSVLVFSDFVPTRRFAELTAITMCSALPGDVLLLPALLQIFGRRATKSASLKLKDEVSPPDQQTFDGQ